MPATITCRDCLVVFDAPTTRGRRPVRCLSCRGLVKPKVATLFARKKPGRKPAKKAVAKKAAQANSKTSKSSTGTRTRKTAKKAPTSVSAPSRTIKGKTVAAVPVIEPTPIKKGEILSGFCNPRHSPEIHNICKVSACICKCHHV